MTDTTNPPADELLRRAEAYLSALHGSVARHDNLAANYGCAGCELRDQIRAAASAPEPETTGPTAALSEAEQTMLAYALDQAQERIWSEGGFTEEDQAAVDSLRHRAVLPADRAAIERVRSVLESEAVVGRSALDYRGLITSALMADAVPVSGPGGAADETQAEPESGCAHCGGPHAWDDCETYTALVASERQPETQGALKRAHVALAAQAGRQQAALARIGQMTDHWEQHLPEVIRTPAVVSAIRAALGPAVVSQPEPAPPVEHCIHDRAVHRTHHTTPVTGCPWCTTAAGKEA
jgi:hypothetical protein